MTTGSGKGASGKGVLVEFTATALRAGSGELKLEGVRVTDTKGDVIAVSMQDGQVTFTGDVIVPTATAAPTTPTPTLPPVPPTATLIPTLPVAAATQTPTEVAATPAEATSEPEPTATATPEETLEPVETRIVRIATETAQALRTAMAEWTPTPSVTPTPEPASPTPTGSLAVEQPGAAASATPVIEQAATPAAPAPEQGGRNTLPLLVGGAAIVGVGAAAVWLIRRRTSS